MPLKVRFAETAQSDLNHIATWIASESDPDLALAYIARIEQRCATLKDFPRRGRLRRRHPEIRSLPFERRALILYRVQRGSALILRVLHAGRDADRELIRQ